MRPPDGHTAPSTSQNPAQRRSSMVSWIVRWISYRLPICTTALCCAIGAVFLHGMMQEQTQVSFSGPQLPASTDFIYRTVGNYPECLDLRNQVSRLLVYPFAHIGYFHVISNLISLFGYGSCMEKANGHFSVLFFFLFGVIIGGLGHSFVFPYIGLVGASCGVYGIIGGLTASCVFGETGVADVWWKHLVLSIALSIQIFVDVICYFFYYQQTVGYAGHFFGFLGGLTLSFAQGRMSRRKASIWWKRVLNILGFLAMSLLVSFLVYNRVTSYPPVPPTFLDHPDTFHFHDRSSCCLELFNLVSASYSFVQAREDHICIN